ncbi:MAG: hypothetical protein Q9160_007722 [Pyrenula sp. 1 TL-2023]
MFSSPAKRRKISSTIAVPISVDASERPVSPGASQTQPAPGEANGTEEHHLTPSRSQRRASFQSPTKASLARYNPALIRQTTPRAHTRSQFRPQPREDSLARHSTRSVGKKAADTKASLVQQVLGGRRENELRRTNAEMLGADATTTTANIRKEDTNKAQSPRQDSFSTAIQRAFRSPQPGALSHQREPLRPRQPSGTLPTLANAPDEPIKPAQSEHDTLRTWRSSLRELAPHYKGTGSGDYDDIFSTLSRRDRRSESPDVEPELPPTPIQLGISVRPTLPRGLESLSSGSRRRRFRETSAGKESSANLRGGHDEVVTSSPLKRRSLALPQDQSAAIGQEIEEQGNVGFEAPLTTAPESENAVIASGFEQTEPVEETNSSPDPETLEQRKTLETLKKQLRHLQAEFTDLSTLVEEPQNQSQRHTESEIDPPIDPKLLTVLTTKNPSCDPTYDLTQPSPRKTIPEEILDAFKASVSIPNGVDPLPYLTVFSPGNLHLSRHTQTLMQEEKIHQLHTLVLTAPPPFPSHVFGAEIEVLVNAEDEAVKSLKVNRLGRTAPQLKLGKRRRQTGSNNDADASWTKTSLGRWVTHRLESGSLHALDVGGLIWGIGRWWDAAVDRARLWVEMSRGTTEAGNGTLKKDPSIADLLPHLWREGMTVPIHLASDARRKQIRVHLAYSLELDWTGEVERRVDVSVEGVDLKTEGGVKDVFGMLLKRRKIGKDGLVGGNEGEEVGWKRVWDAFEGCVGLLGGQSA